MPEPAKNITLQIQKEIEAKKIISFIKPLHLLTPDSKFLIVGNSDELLSSILFENYNIVALNDLRSLDEKTLFDAVIVENIISETDLSEVSTYVRPAGYLIFSFVNLSWWFNRALLFWGYQLFANKFQSSYLTFPFVKQLIRNLGLCQVYSRGIPAEDFKPSVVDHIFSRKTTLAYKVLNAAQKENLGNDFRCLLCGNTNINSFETLYCNLRQIYGYKTCNKCKSGILFPMPTNEVFTEKYDTEIYYDELSQKNKNKILDRLFNVRFYKLPSEDVLSNIQISKNHTPKILDVGCGNGEFLYELKHNQWDIYASDLSKIALKRTMLRTSEDQSHFFEGDFSEINFKKNKFDLIGFWHVLEHVQNPLAYLKKAYSLTNPGGYIVGEVPNYDSVVFRIFKKFYSWIMVPEHIIYYSNESLKFALEKAGYVDIEIYNPNRAILNFSLSIKEFLMSKIHNRYVCDLIFYLSLPVTMILMAVFSFANKGEVLRFRAKK